MLNDVIGSNLEPHNGLSPGILRPKPYLPQIYRTINKPYRNNMFFMFWPNSSMVKLIEWMTVYPYSHRPLWTYKERAVFITTFTRVLPGILNVYI